MKQKSAKKQNKEFIKECKNKQKGEWKKVKTTCTVCGWKRTIHTTNPEIYTDEVKKQYVCVFCEYILKWTREGKVYRTYLINKQKRIAKQWNLDK